MRSPRLVWGGGGRVRVRRHRRLRPLCRAPRDQPPNFFPGRRPLPRGRRWQPAGPQGARARRSRRRRRRGSESGEVNRRSQSLDPGPGRARRARGSPACARARGSYPLASVALVELSDPGASQWPGGSSGSRPRVEGGAAAARGRRGCGASSLSPNQAISLQSAAGALGAHTAQDLPPGGEPASSPYFSAPAPGPSLPWMWTFGWVRGFSLSPRRRRWRRRWRRVPHSLFSPQGASAFAYCLLSFGRRSGDRSFLLSKSLERFGVAPSWAGQGESRLLLDKLSSLDSLIWGAVPVKDLSCPHPHRSWDRAMGQSAPRFRI